MSWTVLGLSGLIAYVLVIVLVLALCRAAQEGR